MRGMGKIVSQLKELRSTMNAANANDEGRLEAFTNFGSNPGELECRVFLPTGAPRALVVVLHGCTQSASVYDAGSGWSKLAEKHGFAVLFPQQRRSNNPNLCFNWYVPSDARRGHGEAMSISQIVQKFAGSYGLTRSHTFITGLSAGGAMAAVMLACYPELFAGGAIIAGLPFAAANTLPEALERMRGQGFPPRKVLASRAEAAADFQGSPSTLAVWHGSGDTIVDLENATAIVHQWLDLHGLDDAEGKVEAISGHRREVWTDSQSRPCVERYTIRGMGHGTPLDTRDKDGCGRVGPHMLEARICSTSRIASSWGLLNHRADTQPRPALSRTEAEAAGSQPPRLPKPASSSVTAVIEDALRAAGLMR